MVTALLIGTNAWGTIKTLGDPTVTPGEYNFTSLKAAFAGAESGDTIRLMTTMESGQSAWLGTKGINDSPKTLTLDLNGNSYTFHPTEPASLVNSVVGIALTHGKLTIMTSQPNGKMIANGGADIVRVYGTYQRNNTVDGDTEHTYNYAVRNVDNTPFSHLIINEGVLLDASHGTCGVNIDVLRPSQWTYSEIVGNEFVWLGCNLSGDDQLTYRTDILNKGSNYGLAHGVRIDIYGNVLGNQYGLKANGKLRNPFEFLKKNDPDDGHLSDEEISNACNSYRPTGYLLHNTDTAYMPFVFVHKQAVIQAHKTNVNSAAVYASGGARWHVEGECSASTGIYAKSGTIEVADGVVTSTNSTSTTPLGVGTNGMSGLTAGGSAIVLVSTDYTGYMSLNISGDSKISGDGRYAIEETVPEGQVVTDVDNIVIEGGSIEGGNSGAIVVSQKTINEANEVVVYGGNISGEVSAGTTGNLDNLLPGAEYFPTEITVTDPEDPTKTKTVVVVSKGTEPEEVVPDDPTDENAKYTIQNTTETWVNWTGTVDQEINANKTLDYLEMNLMVDDDDDSSTPKVAAEQKLIVKDGDTLTVGRVVLGEKAKIIVEPGGNFIVSGKQGIVAPKVANIELQSSEVKQAYFLFNPSVTSNKYPNATVAFESKAYNEGGKHVYQRFGVPTWDREGTDTDPKHYNTAMKSLHKEYGNSWVAQYDYTIDNWGAWQSFGGESNFTIVDALPFRGYLLASNNAKADKMKYEFAGQLIGNQNENLHMYNGWNYFANSYTAPVDIKEFINTVIATLGEENKNKILATVYLYMDSGNDDYIWYGVNKTNAGEDGFMIVGEDIQQFKIPTTIQPMQAFLLRLNAVGEADQAINYGDDVYTPFMEPASLAPARTAQSKNEMQVLVSGNSSWDKVQIIENDNFSDEMDNGYDAYKYNEGRGVSLYALNGEANMDIFATDDAEGTFIGIDAKQAGNYTMHIEGVEGMEYAIVDMQTNAVINAVNGTKYQFYTAAGKNDYRFQIVSASKVVTDIDNVEIKENVKGVYTITGQYLGENVDALPAGLYIINGVKVVK